MAMAMAMVLDTILLLQEETLQQELAQVFLLGEESQKVESQEKALQLFKLILMLVKL